MVTITEDYCGFETAKLLKEKGFHEKVNHVYHYYTSAPFYRRHLRDFNGEDYKNLRHEHYSAPTLQMAMKWLREVHHIHIEICLYKTNEDDIEPKKDIKAPYYTFGVWDSVTGYNVDERLINDFIGDTYEQACEAAIKYCLENLI